MANSLPGTFAPRGELTGERKGCDSICIKKTDESNLSLRVIRAFVSLTSMNFTQLYFYLMLFSVSFFALFAIVNNNSNNNL